MLTFIEQNAVNLIGHVLTILGIIAGATTVVWQLGRQHQSALLLQRNNAKEELKLRLHNLLVEKIRILSNASIQASMYAYMIPSNIESYQRQLALGLRPSSLEERASEFSRLHSEANAALLKLIQEFEAWSIAFPGLEIFQVALNAANHDAREAFMPLFRALLRVLPIDPPKDAALNFPGPLIPGSVSSDEHAELKILVERYKKGMDEIGNYVYDLTIESQNNLLSGLFERRVSTRQPLDINLKAISADPEKAEQLLRYFENETSWGKEKRAAEAAVRARLEKP